MKKFLLVAAVLISFSSISFAQSSTGFTYNFIRGYCQGLGYSIGQEWNANLAQGDYFTKTFTFDEGVEYDIVALSEDNDVQDVDIQILTPSGDVYTQDTKTSAYAEVNFTPSYTRTLTIKVKNYRSRTPNYASKVYFMIAYRR
jgi:hypothetical protein